MNIFRVFILIALAALFGCERVQVKPFPQAAEVRLYINPKSIDVSPQGKVNEGSYPENGIRLTTDELHSIQSSLYYTKPPEAIAACCVPRHAFLFYDKAHKFLGSVTVCFECGCATIDGQTPKPPANMDWLDWDETRFAHIIEAHGQTVHF